MVKLKIVTRSGKDLLQGSFLTVTGTVEDLKNAFHTACKDKKVKSKVVYYPERQRWTLPAAEGERPTALEGAKKLSDYGLKDGDSVVFKDLGPQIGYKTVFFWEYFGPLCTYVLVFLLAPQIHGRGLKPVLAQRLALAYHSFHYVKRIAETFLVHEFSHGTMPISNLFKNCTYYWTFAALISYYINHPLYTSPPEARVKACFVAALCCQALNAYSHLVLAGLRKGGSKEYKIPYSLLAGFNFVTCANYMWEILGWACFNGATQSLIGVTFMLAGAAQMADWANKKHARLRKTFDGKEGRPKYPRRWKMLPPLF